MSPENKSRIARLNEGFRFWAISPAHGRIEPLEQALDLLSDYYQPGDHIILLGSQIGQGGQSLRVMDTLNSFKHWLGDEVAGSIEKGLVNSSQVVWLRGIQEVLIDKFYTLHMAPSPADVLDWMVDTYQFDKLLDQLGCEINEAHEAIAAGAAPLAHFTNAFHHELHANVSNASYFSSCRRAALSKQGHLLFVHGGLDPARTLSMQTDAFWFGHPDYFRLSKPYQNFTQVISGLVPSGSTEVIGPGRFAFDGGCGRGGYLSLRCFSSKGTPLFEYEFSS